jgi:asparagine N-glycosylation enzyme membrane subunit Stt3
MDRRDLLPALLLAAFGLALHAVLAGMDGRVLAGLLPDSDSYTRLIRVRELWDGAGWQDPVTLAFNAPQGLFLHWTRPLDALILGPAWLLHAGGLPRDAAILWSGAVLCPVLHVAASLAAVWAARAVWGRSASWLAGLFLLSAPPLVAYSVFGRADHHTLIALAGVLTLGFALHALRGRRGLGAAAGVGLAGGAGLWVSPEGVLFLAPALAGFGLAWAFGPAPRRAAAQGLVASLAAAAVVLAAILAERGVSGAGFVAYDVVSLPQLVMSLSAAAVFALAWPVGGGWRLRVAAGAVLAALGAALLLRAFPGLLSAAPPDTDADAARLFLPFVDEMQPLRFTTAEQARRALVFLGGAGLAAPLVLLAALWPARGARRLALAALGLALAVNLMAAVQHLRFTADLAVPAALLAAGIPSVMARLFARAPVVLLLLARSATIVLVVLQPVIASALLPRTADRGAARDRCEPVAAGRWLATWPGRGAAPFLLVSDDVDSGPALAWHGRLRVLAGPYHRAGAAFADLSRVFGAADAAAAEAVLRARGADALLLCRGLGRRFAASPFRAALLAGDMPPWLEPVPLPAPLDARLLLLRVLPPAP